MCHALYDFLWTSSDNEIWGEWSCQMWYLFVERAFLSFLMENLWKFYSKKVLEFFKYKKLSFRTNVVYTDFVSSKFQSYSHQILDSINLNWILIFFSDSFIQRRSLQTITKYQYNLIHFNWKLFKYNSMKSVDKKFII